MDTYIHIYIYIYIYIYMCVLVTGASSDVGGHVAKCLIDNCYSVHPTTYILRPTHKG